MKEKTSLTLLCAIVLGLFAILMLTGASRGSGGPWAISASSGEIPGLYIMNQSNGDIYFLENDPDIARNHAEIEKLGNISDAR